MATIKTLFAQQIDRTIEEVIKVDQNDEQIVRQELREYVTTDAIQKSFVTLLDRYAETPNKPHEGIGIWVSGFFGSGKSSFAKYFGLGIENRPLVGEGAATILQERFKGPKAGLLLQQITEKIPTHLVIFDVSTEKGIQHNETLTKITYLALLRSLGYASNLDLAELEIALEADGKLAAFKTAFHALFPQHHWDARKHLAVFALNEASAVLNQLEPSTYPAADSWVKGARAQADINAGLLARRCKELIERRATGKALLFVVDEVGQFVSKDVQKMLDLQAIVQQLGVVGRGKFWLVVTSQEKLTELVSGLDDRRVELARVMDRFPQDLQVHLEPSDISEVTSRRVLEKNKAAENLLKNLFDTHRARLADCTKVTAEITLPPLTAQAFVDLYPLLPYQVDLIIQVVSGLRMQGGASRHVGGANRTIIKLAQQLLIGPQTNLASQEVGQLVTFEHVYDLVSPNVDSETRGKITDIPKHVTHTLAASVAKAICLLQFVKAAHRTAENIAAVLHPAVAADSLLPQVREALNQLEKGLLVRKGDDGYRIPSPVEDDWERRRETMEPKAAERNQLLAETVTGFWEPQPTQTLLEVKSFKAGLVLQGKVLIDGDIPVNIHLAQEGGDFEEKVEEFRKRSQADNREVFWVGALNAALEEDLRQVFRSSEMIKPRGGPQGADQGHLLGEERHRLTRHKEELRRRLKDSLLSGTVFFHGNDRSPQGATAVDAAVKTLLAQALPEVYPRFKEAAARVEAKDLTSVLSADSLKGLSPLFTKLHLLQEAGTTVTLAVDQAPLAEIFKRIKHQADFGDAPTGKQLEEAFRKEPYGWEADMVRLLVACLLRAGKLVVQSGGQSFDQAGSLAAKTAFTNNTAYKAASFQPKEAMDFKTVAQVAEAFKATFGRELEINQGKLATEIRKELEKHAQGLQQIHTLLVRHHLPGDATLQQALEHIQDIRSGNEEHTILTFKAHHHGLKDTLSRASELQAALHEVNLAILEKAGKTLHGAWAFLQGEPDAPPELQQKGVRLADLLGKETFFRDIPEIDQLAQALQGAYEVRREEALQARATVYQAALDQLRHTTGWAKLDAAQQELQEKPFLALAKAYADGVSIPQLRAERNAALSLLQKAQAKVLSAQDAGHLVTLRLADYFNGGIETPEQLEAALQRLREACAGPLAAGNRILLQ